MAFGAKTLCSAERVVKNLASWHDEKCNNTLDICCGLTTSVYRAAGADVSSSVAIGATAPSACFKSGVFLFSSFIAVLLQGLSARHVATYRWPWSAPAFLLPSFIFTEEKTYGKYPISDRCYFLRNISLLKRNRKFIISEVTESDRSWKGSHSAVHWLPPSSPSVRRACVFEGGQQKLLLTDLLPLPCSHTHTFLCWRKWGN